MKNPDHRIERSIPSPFLVVTEQLNPVALALNLVPFAGIAFLWFIAVVRDRRPESISWENGPMENPGQLIDVFLTIFIGMGPVKALLVYLGLTVGAQRNLQRKVAQKAIVTATVIALLLLVAGVLFMRILHFTTSALTIAGGLILLILALNIVLSPAPKEEHAAAPDEATLMSTAVYPLGIPLLLNPVGIVSLTIFSAESETLIQVGIIALIVLLVAAIDFGIFMVSHRLDKYLTHERILVLEKLLGILLAALAVQMILNGLSELGVITLTNGH